MSTPARARRPKDEIALLLVKRKETLLAWRQLVHDGRRQRAAELYLEIEYLDALVAYHTKGKP